MCNMQTAPIAIFNLIIQRPQRKIISGIRSQSLIILIKQHLNSFALSSRF